jgi:tRNA(Arg) A34 adenosine deaminase TadA/ADP-ribose pyrophosphatase YjhB (NUDIX family)
VVLRHVISTLLYCFNARDEVLLLHRRKEPNRGLWSPCGGKLKTTQGESPYACACREASEELGVALAPADLHLTGLVSERGCAGQAHWLMFLFEVRRTLNALPPPNREGRFQFFPRDALDRLPMPPTDREQLWPLFWQHRGGFFAAHCRCRAHGRNDWTLEETAIPGSPPVGRKQPSTHHRQSDRDPVDEPIIDLQSDSHFMGEALRQAQRACAAGEVPVGAVIVRAGRIIARACNQVERLKDATAHAEMLALTQAEEAVGDWRLTDCTLYVTKEPCPMCAGAIVHVRLTRVVFGASDPQAGAAGSALNLLQFPSLNHRCEITDGVRGAECQELLRRFFGEQRRRSRPSASRPDPEPQS